MSNKACPKKIPIDLSRLALGTAQIGMKYGINNKTEAISNEDAQPLLSFARKVSINTLDTANSYGVSELRLGEIGVNEWRIITKIPRISPNILDNEIKLWTTNAVTKSMDRLKVSTLYGLLLHHPLDLIDRHGESIYEELNSLKEKGLIKKIGISVYEPSELESIIDQFEIDIVQLPINAFDQRFKTLGWLSDLKRRGIEIHGRSIFLQGLLLMNKDQRPKKFEKWGSLWNDWDQWLIDVKITPLQACLSISMAIKEIDKIIIGFDNLTQLQQVTSTKIISPIAVPNNFLGVDNNLINPSKWASL